MKNLNTLPVATVTFVYGVASDDATEAHLLNSINMINSQINDLAGLKDESKYVAAKIMSLNSDKVKIIKILDSRTPAVQPE